MNVFTILLCFLLSINSNSSEGKDLNCENSDVYFKTLTKSFKEPLKITSFHYKDVNSQTLDVLSETDAVCVISFYNDSRIVRIKFPEGSLGYKMTNFVSETKEISTELNWTVEDKTVIGYKLIVPKASAATLLEARSDKTFRIYSELQIEFP